jgi:hypothetical protein
MMTKKLLVSVLLAFLFSSACKTPAPTSETSTPEGETFSAKNECRKARLVGWASESAMSEQDRQAFERAQSNCKKIFTASPCLVEFILRGPGNYWAICGAKTP